METNDPVIIPTIAFFFALSGSFSQPSKLELPQLIKDRKLLQPTGIINIEPPKTNFLRHLDLVSVNFKAAVKTAIDRAGPLSG